MVSTGAFVNMRLSRGALEIRPGWWWYKCLSRGLQVIHTLVQGRCNQIDACPGCTLKPVPGGVDKTDACSGVILHIVPGVTFAINNGIAPTNDSPN